MAHEARDEIHGDPRVIHDFLHVGLGECGSLGVRQKRKERAGGYKRDHRCNHEFDQTERGRIAGPDRSATCRALAAQEYFDYYRMPEQKTELTHIRLLSRTL